MLLTKQLSFRHFSKYLLSCFTEECKSYKFRTTWGEYLRMNWWIYSFVWTIPIHVISRDLFVSLSLRSYTLFIPLLFYFPDADTDLCCSDVTPHKSMMTVMMRWRLYDLMILLPQPWCVCVRPPYGNEHVFGGDDSIFSTTWLYTAGIWEWSTECFRRSCI